MKIAPGVYEIRAAKRGYFKAGHTKAFLVDDGEQPIVVDTHYDADAKLILDEIARIGRSPEDIKHIVLTHTHRGHLGGMATLKRLSGAPIYAMNGRRISSLATELSKPRTSSSQVQLRPGQSSSLAS